MQTMLKINSKYILPVELSVTQAATYNRPSLLIPDEV